MRRLALLCTLAACGGAIKIEDLPNELVKTICAKYAQCGAAHSEASCASQFSDGLLVNSYSDEISKGTIKYDGAAARSCLDSYAKTSCSSFALDDSDDSCERVYQGQVAIGSMCSNTTECVNTAYCALTMSGMMCSGTCTARVPVGGMATASTQCEKDLRVVGGTCTKPPAEGEACTTASSCLAGLNCVAMVCKRPGEKGAGCDSVNRCATFFTCVGGTCHELLDISESCARTDAGTPSCKIDLFCDSTTMVCGEPGGDGAACSSTSACRDPLVCARPDGGTGACRNAATESQSCASVGCDSKTYCDSMTRICKKRIVAGQPCPSGTQCETNSFCNNGTCQSFFTDCP